MCLPSFSQCHSILHNFHFCSKLSRILFGEIYRQHEARRNCMLNIEAHEVPFSFEQPDSVLSPLVAILQQVLNDPRTRALRGKIFLSAYYVVIIDAHEERAQYIAQALTAMGYQSLIATTALDAFKLFLQGQVVPFALILGQEDSSNRLFLHRLVQQVAQRAGWELLLIRLLSKS